MPVETICIKPYDMHIVVMFSVKTVAHCPGSVTILCGGGAKNKALHKAVAARVPSTSLVREGDLFYEDFGQLIIANF